MYWYEYDIKRKKWYHMNTCWVWTIKWGEKYDIYINMHDAYELMWTWMNIEYENRYE